MEMEKQKYISDGEHEKCVKVRDAFSELYEIEDVLVVDAGRYGFVVMKFYTPPHGFEDFETFTDSRSFFDALWNEWLNTKIYLLARGTPLMEKGYRGVFECLPEEKQKELTGRKSYFMEKAGIKNLK